MLSACMCSLLWVVGMQRYSWHCLHSKANRTWWGRHSTCRSKSTCHWAANGYETHLEEDVTQLMWEAEEDRNLVPPLWELDLNWEVSGVSTVCDDGREAAAFSGDYTLKQSYTCAAVRVVAQRLKHSPCAPNRILCRSAVIPLPPLGQ
jgi:hypothetical protein